MKLALKKVTVIEIVLILVLSTIGGLYLWYTWNKSTQSASFEVLKMAKLSEAALPKEYIKKMDLNSSDLDKPEYKELKANLMAIPKIDNRIRFAYILVKNNDMLYILADSESPDSKDYSPPGQEFTESALEDYVPFDTKQPYITSPVKDRWGTWITALVPMFDESGEMIGAFGMDFPAENWNDAAYTKLFQAVGIILFLLFILITFFTIYNKNLDIKENEKNFRGFFETVDDLVVVTDDHGKIKYTNKAVTKKSSFTPGELFDMHISDLYAKEARKNIEDCIKKALSGKTNYCSAAFQKKDGSQFPAEVRAWSGKWSGKNSIFSISKDTTVEMELLQKFNIIFENNPALMAITDPSTGKFTDVNATFLKKMGFKKEEIIGKTSKQLGLFVDQNKRDDLQKRILNGVPIKNVELRVKSKSGAILDGSFSGEPLEIGGKAYILTVMIDDTERKKTEKEILDKNVQLEELNKVFVNRELKMTELKREIEILKRNNQKTA